MRSPAPHSHRRTSCLAVAWLSLVVVSTLPAQELELRSVFGEAGKSGRIHSVAFSPDGKLLAAGDGKGNPTFEYSAGTVRLWNVATGKEEAAIKAHRAWVLSVSFSPDGKSLASSGGFNDPTVRLWDVTTYQEKAVLRGSKEPGWVSSVAFSPDGTTLAAGDGTVRLWDLTTYKEKAVVGGDSSGMWFVAYSPDGTLLATGGGSTRVVRLWDVATRTETAALKGLRDGVQCLVFSPDGRTLASGGNDEDPWVRLWDVATGKEKDVFRWNTGSAARCVAFSPDGKTLAYVSGYASLWDVAAGRKKATLGRTHVRSVAFSPDGKTLASGEDDGMIRLWDVPGPLKPLKPRR